MSEESKLDEMTLEAIDLVAAKIAAAVADPLQKAVADAAKTTEGKMENHVERIITSSGDQMAGLARETAMTNDRLSEISRGIEREPEVTAADVCRLRKLLFVTIGLSAMAFTCALIAIFV